MLHIFNQFVLKDTVLMMAANKIKSHSLSSLTLEIDLW